VSTPIALGRCVTPRSEPLNEVGRIFFGWAGGFVAARKRERHAGATISAALGDLAEADADGLSFQGTVEEAVLDLLANGTEPARRAA
jgi:hypothetical protein